LTLIVALATVLRTTVLHCDSRLLQYRTSRPTWYLIEAYGRCAEF